MASRQNCALLAMRLFRQGKQEAAQDLENYFLLRIFKSPYEGPVFPKRTMAQGERNFFIELQAEYALKLELMAQGREFEPGTPPERLLFDSDTETEFVAQAFADFPHGRKRQKIQKLGEEFLQAI